MSEIKKKEDLNFVRKLLIVKIVFFLFKQPKMIESIKKLIENCKKKWYLKLFIHSYKRLDTSDSLRMASGFFWTMSPRQPNSFECHFVIIVSFTRKK